MSLLFVEEMCKAFLTIKDYFTVKSRILWMYFCSDMSVIDTPTSFSCNCTINYFRRVCNINIYSTYITYGLVVPWLYDVSVTDISIFLTFKSDYTFFPNTHPQPLPSPTPHPPPYPFCTPSPPLKKKTDPKGLIFLPF